MKNSRRQVASSLNVKRIESRMRELNISKSELAYRLGITSCTLWRNLTGKAGGGRMMAIALSQILSLSEEEIMAPSPTLCSKCNAVLNKVS